MRQHADRIAANTEIDGMAEAHHAAKTQDQIEAHRRHRQNDDAGEQRKQEPASAKLDVHWQKRQCGEQHDNRDRA